MRLLRLGLGRREGFSGFLFRVTRVGAPFMGVLVGAGILALGLADAALGPPPVKPDIPQGEVIYRQACSSCHDQPTAKPDFRRRDWKLERSPQMVAAAALGATGHPAAVTDPALAWHASAYTWTLSTSKAEVLRGLELAREAEARLKALGLFALVSHLSDLNALRDPAWVLTHTPAEVEARLAAISGDAYRQLDDADRIALTEYVYASHFTWPPTWEDTAQSSVNAP